MYSAIITSKSSLSEAIDRYVNWLIAGVAYEPSMYCFVNGANEEQLSILKEEVLELSCTTMHWRVGAESDPTLPYGSDSLEETVSQVNGYCGLEVWASWENVTDENLQYAQDKTLQMLKNDSIKLKGLDNLKALTASAGADEHEDGAESEALYHPGADSGAHC